MSTQTIDPRAKFWGNIAKVFFLLIAFAVFAPVIWLAVGGIIGFILFLAIVIGAWMMRPWVFAKAANIRLKLIKHEAAKNPVETLQNELHRQSAALDQRKAALTRLNGQIRTLETKIKDLGHKYGTSDRAYIDLNKQYKDLNRLADVREEKWKDAKRQLNLFEQEIERAGMVWEAAKAAAEATASSGLTEDDLMAKLRTDTSLDSIRDSFNIQLAALDTELMQAEADRPATASA